MTDLIRRGIYALPAAGILTAVPWVFVSKPFSLAASASINGNPSITDPQGYARILTSTGYVVSSNLYLAGLICLLFGLLALYAYLARPRASSFATVGMIFSVVGIALALPVLGVQLRADTVLADVYLSGHKDVSAAMGLLTDKTLTYGTTANFALPALLSVIGAVGYGVAVWRSKSLPRWTGVLLGSSFFLSMLLSPVVSWVGALGLVIVGIRVATIVSRTRPVG